MAYGKITPKQQEILDFIKSEILSKGYPPAVRDICEAVHLKSTSSSGDTGEERVYPQRPDETKSYRDHG